MLLGTYRGAYAGFRACKCENNHYRVDRFGPCFRCPVHGSCKNEVLYFKNGYYVDWNAVNSSISYYVKFIENLNIIGDEYDRKYVNMTERLPQANQCLNPAACKSNLSTSCQKGYKGFLCDSCEKGYYKVGYACSVCPSKREKIRNIAIASVIFFLMVTMSITLSIFKSNKSQLNRLLSKAKIAINYYQITSQIYDVLSFVQWPKEILRLITYLKVMELDPITIFSIPCWFTEVNLYSKFMVFAYINGCILAIMFAGLLLLQMFHFLGIIKQDKIQVTRKCLTSLVSVLIFLLYPMTTVSFVQILPLACKTYYLLFQNKLPVHRFMQDPTMACFSDSHNRMLPYAYISCIYVAGLPICVPIGIWYCKSKLSHETKSVPVKKDVHLQSISHDDMIKLPSIQSSTQTFFVEDKLVKNFSVAQDVHYRLDQTSLSQDNKMEFSSISPMSMARNIKAAQDFSHQNGTALSRQDSVTAVPFLNSTNHTSHVEDKPAENLSLTKDVYEGLYVFYGNYREKYFFWESIEMIRKVLLSSIAVIIGGRSRTSLCLIVMLSGISAVLHAHFKPIANNTEHLLQLVCLAAIFSNLLAGLSLKMSVGGLESDVQKDSVALTVILVICNVIIAILLSGK